ncbi:MAG: hypothetical protein ACLR07_14575 [Christensenellales bacterium]
MKGKSMRTLEEVKRLADGFRKLYDDARVLASRTVEKFARTTRRGSAMPAYETDIHAENALRRPHWMKKGKNAKLSPSAGMSR